LLGLRRAVGIGRGEERAVTLPLEQMSQLADRGGLARSVDADHEDDRRRAEEVEVAETLAHLRGENLLQVAERVGRRAKVRLGGLATELLDDPLRGRHAGVGRDQRRLEIVPEGFVEGRSSEDFFEVGNIGPAARLEAF